MIQHKKAEREAFLKHNVPKKRTMGRGARRCSLCLRFGAHIRRYDINLCRQCFRENARDLGFKKLG